MAYYQIIGGKRYDRSLLEAAKRFTQGSGEYQISLDEIQDLFRQANDSQVLTSIERRTLDYIAQHFPLTAKAKKWFLAQGPNSGESTTEMAIRKVLREKFGLQKIQSNIEESTVQQNLAGSVRDFEAALSAAIEAVLGGGQGQLCLLARVASREDKYLESQIQAQVLKSYLDRCTIYLVPTDATASMNLPYDLPHVLDSENFWTFVFKTPDFEPIEFFSFVNRGQSFQYSIGQFSKKANFDLIIQSIIQQFTGFDRMKWDISIEELNRQMPIIPGQNFGNALFAALNAGIFNQESSFSFGDFIRQEIWPDPEKNIREEMREYANSGTLYLIPLDYRAQTDNGTAAFPVPEQFSFWLDGEWIFGLNMPSKTNAQFVISAPRDGNDGDTAWIDGFLDEALSIETQIQKIVTEEFKIEGLQINIDTADAAVQRQQFGPEWRHLPGLVRQALNTILHDYLSDHGVFNKVAKRHLADIDPTFFDDPMEYRAAIRHKIKEYLRTESVLQMRPINPDENLAPNGEPIEQNWLFRVVLQNLADHWFWIIIQRHPDDEGRPYNYIS